MPQNNTYEEFAMNGITDRVSGKLKNIMEEMNIPFYISSIAEDYTKRVLEAKYDKLAETRLFQRLKNMEERERMLLEFAFYALNASLKNRNRIGVESSLKMYFKGIAEDFFPEMGKRLINGDTLEGKEVIELVCDSTSNTFTQPPKSKNELLNPLRRRCINYLRRKEGD